MCQKYAQILEGFLDRPLSNSTTVRMLPQAQPKGRKMPQLISEFLDVVTTLMDHEPVVDHKKNLVYAHGNIPAGSRLLRTEADRGQSGQVLCVFGIFRTMEQFVLNARVLWHPFDELRNLPDLMIKSLFVNLTSSPHQLAKQRCEFLRKWSNRAKELQTAEGKVHRGLTTHIQQVLAGKRTLLMEELAAEMGWPDKTLFSEMREGFKLVGTFAATGVFKPAVTLAQMSEEELRKNTKFLRPAILGKLKNFDDEVLQKELYDTTLSEAVEKHWLEGPYDVSEMHHKFGEHWLPVKRFGVVQKGKLRPIDNFKESMLNLTFGCYEKIELKAMEHSLWMLVTLVRCMRHLGEVEFVLSDGSVLKGCVHPTWGKVAFGLETTCVDMKSAYKQLPLNPAEYHRTVVSLWDVVKHKPSCFIMRTLPFGASASVHHFLRISSFIHAVGLHAGLCWGAYFDDFPTICNVANRQSTLSITLGLFELLGFKYNDEKLEPFDRVAAMLGVELDLREAHRGMIKVQNKPTRVAEITECLQQILDNGVIQSDSLPSNLGKLQFAEAQLWGRTGKIAVTDLREATIHRAGTFSISDQSRKAIEILLERFSSGRPREIRSSVPCKPHLLFVDGALEYDKDGNPWASIGGVMLTRNGEAYCFGCDVPEQLLKAWQTDGRTHVIGLVELYAAVTGLNTWRNLLCNDRVLLFTDSWPAYDALVKGTASVKEWRDLLLDLEKIDDKFPMFLWTARVPSASNPADPPSRRNISGIAFLGDIKVIDARCPVTDVDLKSFEMV